MDHTFKIPLQQHIGAPCKPVVNVGDRVKRGQLIAAPEKLGANIHASVSGTAKAITDEFIEIEPDKEQPEDYVPIKETSRIIEAIKEAGIVGMGGAGFPTHVKMDVDLQDGVVIANGVAFCWLRKFFVLLQRAFAACFPLDFFLQGVVYDII